MSGALAQRPEPAHNPWESPPVEKGIIGRAARDGDSGAGAPRASTIAIHRLGTSPHRALSARARDMETVASLCERYQVDLAHARQVAAHTVVLLKALRARVPVSDRLIDLGEMAGLLHNLAMTVDESNHHTVGRDLIAAAAIEGVDATECAMLACTTRFHRKKVDAEAEPLLQTLDAARREDVMVLTAALRVADGLDYSGGQTTRLAAVTITDAGTWLRLRGPFAVEDGARALVKAKPWDARFPILHIHARQTRPGADGDMPLDVAARRTLRYLLDTTALRRPGRLPDAVGRTRAALRRVGVWGRLFQRHGARSGARGGARGGGVRSLAHLATRGAPARMAEALVRDLDAYLGSGDEQRHADLAPLRAVWVLARDEAARVYAERLSRAQVRATVRHLRRWAEQRPKATPAALSPLGEPACLRHIGPPALERALADVRVFDTLTPDSLAQVRDRYRRAARRLADVADLLRDALPAGRIQPLLAQARLVSHALGRARDAQRAAREALRYLAALPEEASTTLRAAVMAFAAAMDALAHEHLSTVLSQPPFPEPWS